MEEGLPVEVPLAYFYGHVEPRRQPRAVPFLVERLAALLDRRAEAADPAPWRDTLGACALMLWHRWAVWLAYTCQRRP